MGNFVKKARIHKEYELFVCLKALFQLLFYFRGIIVYLVSDFF